MLTAIEDGGGGTAQQHMAGRHAQLEMRVLRSLKDAMQCNSSLRCASSPSVYLTRRANLGGWVNKGCLTPCFLVISGHTCDSNQHALGIRYALSESLLGLDTIYRSCSQAKGRDCQTQALMPNCFSWTLSQATNYGNSFATSSIRCGHAGCYR